MSDAILDAALNRITQAQNDLIYADPHQWSTRPCPTCRTITALVGYPFGCVRYAVEKLQQRMPLQPKVVPL